MSNDNAQTDADQKPAVGAPVERGVGRPVPERAEDRTLLALAAAAANIPCKGWCQPGARTDGWHGMYTGSDDDGAYARWNPLTDDGDALRLAVTLNLRVVFHPALNQALVREYHATDREWQENGEDHASPCAAARRAIVRAAAALGAMKTPNVAGNRLARQGQSELTGLLGPGSEAN